MCACPHCIECCWSSWAILPATTSLVCYVLTSTFRRAGTAPQEMSLTFSHTVPFKSTNVPPTVIKPPTPTPAPTDLPRAIELPKSLGNTPQVVYAPGKEPKAVAASLQALLQRQRKAIAVKVDAAMAKAVAELLPGERPAPPGC